ncbi:MAG: Bud site selection protein, Revert to axial protein 1 [Phylliscum demangeonii]|nr:MAG: Bud site selection protein, Revert to axial protein 1 [Phylliscum demangeonii]
MTTPSPTVDHPRNRLPVLFEVLSRRTLPPVDLYSFYIYMRDQQRSVDYLDFWLDVAQHMSLCRHYVRELRRSVLVETPEHEKRAASAFGDYGQVNDPGGPSMFLSSEEKTHDQRLSAFLRQEQSGNPALGSASASLESDRGRERSYGALGGSGGERAVRPSGGTTPDHGGTRSGSPAHTVARPDIRASAEKILYTFLLPGSEREIILPDSITARVTQSIEEHGRDDPEVFDAAKDYVFQAMERDAFPGFLRAKALSNLVPPSMMLRLVIGLVSLFAGFWTAFVLIFLGYSRPTRLWLIIPFAVGSYALVSHQYALDPVLALLGFSEYTFLSFARIRESYVRRWLNKRAFVVLAVTLLTVTCLVLVFVLVPSTRL